MKRASKWLRVLIITYYKNKCVNTNDSSNDSSKHFYFRLLTKLLINLNYVMSTGLLCRWTLKSH